MTNEELKMRTSKMNITKVGVIIFFLAKLTGSLSAEDLVPSQTGLTPDYFCTWAVQNYVWGQGETSIDNNMLFSHDGVKSGRLNVTEKEIFKPDGWAHLYPKIRGDLIFVLDDGYYPMASSSGGPSPKTVNAKLDDMTALQLDSLRYPSYADSDPAKSLKRLNDDLQKEGWRGLGLWTRKSPKDLSVCKERLNWSSDAGVLYWKIDTGDEELRYFGLRKEFAPRLMLEYAVGMNPFNLGPNGRVPSDYAPRRLALLEHSDVLRIYDRDQPLSLPTSIDRIAALLQMASGKPEAKAVINCEDELYLGAALGCSVGVFRSPYRGLRPNGDMDIFMGGPRHPKQRMDEVTRAIRWHRMAPPFAANLEQVQVDTAVLSDTWKFSLGDSWNRRFNGKECSQAAPARLSRGLPLPKVLIQGAPPWVVASRNPNGAVSVAALGRISPEQGYFIPLADVEVEAGDMPPCFGIFGSYQSLTLRFNKPFPDGARILAQDLAGDTCEDITAQVTISGTALTLPGALIQKVGLSASTPGDLSDPGLVLKIKAKKEN